MPKANPTLMYPTQTIFHWFASGLTLGIIDSLWALLACIGGSLWVPMGFWIANGHFGGLNQHDGYRELLCIAVQYRL